MSITLDGIYPVDPRSVTHEGWPVFSVTHCGHAFIVSSPKCWQLALQTVAEGEGVDASVARFILLDAHRPMGSTGYQMFSTGPRSRLDVDINLAAWAMDTGLSL